MPASMPQPVSDSRPARLVPADLGSTPPVASEQEAPAKVRNPKAKYVALGLMALGLVAGGVAYGASLGKESTDDAQLEGHVHNVSSRVSGVIVRTRAIDNRAVKAGEVLVELDRADFEARLQAASADVQAAE